MCVCVQATHRIHFKAVLTMRHAFPLFKHIPILDNIFPFVKQKNTALNQSGIFILGLLYFSKMATPGNVLPSIHSKKAPPAADT